MASKDLATVNYQYENNQLVLDPKLDGSTTAGDITLVAAGAENTYYIKVGEKYLKSTAPATNPANRSLALVDTSEGAEWLFADGSGNYAGSIIIQIMEFLWEQPEHRQLCYARIKQLLH